jgi:hypothetical protein
MVVLQGNLQMLVVRQLQQQVPIRVSDTSKTLVEAKLTANPTGMPRPAGLAIPAPAAMVEAIPPGALAPNRADGSAGGGDSTEREMI